MFSWYECYMRDKKKQDAFAVDPASKPFEKKISLPASPKRKFLGMPHTIIQKCLSGGLHHKVM